MHPLAKLDHRYLWHPFTQMRDWLQARADCHRGRQGAVLRDVHGREYLDANSSIWTNLHGHNHPRINAAIRRQFAKSPTARRWVWPMNRPRCWPQDWSKQQISRE